MGTFRATCGRSARRVFGAAVLSLVSGVVASACAIDDRELEVTDGNEPSDPLCRIESDDSACIRCDKRRCCSEYAQCVSSEDCVYFVICGANCGENIACIGNCAQTYPVGYDEFLDWTECSNARCPDAC